MGAVALTRAGVVSTFPTVYSARLQETSRVYCWSKQIKTSRSNYLFVSRVGTASPDDPIQPQTEMGIIAKIQSIVKKWSN